MYSLLELVTYQVYNYILVEELKRNIDNKNKETVELFLKNYLDKDISIINSSFGMFFKEVKDSIDLKYNLKYIFEFLKKWEEENNILKRINENDKNGVPYYKGLLISIYNHNVSLEKRNKIGVYFDNSLTFKEMCDFLQKEEVTTCFLLKDYIELYDKNFLALSTKEKNEFFVKMYRNKRDKYCYLYSPNYIFVVRLIKALAYEYACESMENYLNGVDERGPIEKLFQEHTFEEIGKIMGFDHLQGDEFLEKIWELGSQRDISTERRKFANDLLELLNKIEKYYLNDDKDPYLLKGYKDEVHYEDSPKFEDDVLAEIYDAKRYLKVIWHKNFIPKDIAGKYHSRLVKDYQERTGATDF